MVIVFNLDIILCDNKKNSTWYNLNQGKKKKKSKKLKEKKTSERKYSKMFTEIVLQIALVQLSLMVSYCKSLRKEGEFVLGSKEALKSFATTKIASGLQLPALPSL